MKERRREERNKGRKEEREREGRRKGIREEGRKEKKNRKQLVVVFIFPQTKLFFKVL